MIEEKRGWRTVACTHPLLDEDLLSLSGQVRALRTRRIVMRL